MSNITYPNKNTGDLLTAAEINQIKTAVNSKQDADTLAPVATTGNYADLGNKPVNVSDFINDAGYLTSASTGVPATAIGDGSISNTEFSYLNGLTGNIQSQLDSLQLGQIGSISASDITDFDTEVANNSAVAANTAKITNQTHTGDVAGSIGLTIQPNVVTLAKMQQIATDSFLGRDTAGTGNVEVLSLATVRTMLNIADGATANQSDAYLLDRTNHTGSQAISTITGLQTALDAKVESVTAGTNITVDNTDPANPVISAAGTVGEANTASNLGAGTGIFASKSTLDLQFKSLVGGTDISLSSDGTTVTINSTAAAGGQPATTIVDENGNSTNTIAFDIPRKYINATGTLAFDLSSAGGYQTVQVIEHVSNTAPALPDNAYLIGAGSYISDNSTVNMIYCHKVDGESLVGVSFNTKTFAVDAANVTYAGSGVGDTLTPSYDTITNEGDSLFYYERADDSGFTTNRVYWNGSSWGATQTGITTPYTVTAGDSGKYIRVGVRAYQLIDGATNVGVNVPAKNIVLSAGKQIGATATSTIRNIHAQFTYTGGNVDLNSGTNGTNVGGNGVPRREVIDIANDTYMILLPDDGDIVKAPITVPSAPANGTYSEVRFKVRSGVIGDSDSYFTTYNYTIKVGSNTYSIGSGLTDSGAYTQTANGGGMFMGTLVATNVPYTSSDVIEFSCTASWAFLDTIEFIS